MSRFEYFKYAKYILTKLEWVLRCEQNLDGSNQTDTSEPSKPRRPLSKTLKTGNRSFFCNNATQTENYVNSIVMGFELKFPKLSWAVVKGSRAKLGHFNIRAETELRICISINSKFMFLLRTTIKFPNFAHV